MSIRLSMTCLTFGTRERVKKTDPSRSSVIFIFGSHKASRSYSCSSYIETLIAITGVKSSLTSFILIII